MRPPPGKEVPEVYDERDGLSLVFVRSGGAWTQQQRLTPSDAGGVCMQQQLTASDGAPSDLFGASVAISGGTVVVGAHMDNVDAKMDQRADPGDAPCAAGGCPLGG